MMGKELLFNGIDLRWQDAVFRETDRYISGIIGHFDETLD